LYIAIRHYHKRSFLFVLLCLLFLVTHCLQVERRRRRRKNDDTLHFCETSLTREREKAKKTTANYILHFNDDKNTIVICKSFFQ